MEANIELLRCYQQLLTASEHMLKLAREGQWESLIEREMEYVNTVEKISGYQDANTQPPLIQSQIRPLLKQTIANEVELKLLLQKRMDELRTLVGQTSRQQNINTTYGRLSGNILYPSEL